MKLTIGILLVFCMALSACLDEQTMASETSMRIYPSREEVVAKVYDQSYRAPEGFYVDVRATTTRSISIYHVKDPSKSYELCTDDFSEASDWESADNASRSVDGAYVDSVDNDMYFEFIRELAFPDGVGNIDDPTSPGYARIFKCSYVDRNGVDRHLRNGYAGTLNVQPVTEVAMREFSEYLWQFAFFWPERKTVLGSFTHYRDGNYEHTLLLALTTNRGVDMCDSVEVVDWIFTGNTSNGEITKRFIPVYAFEARQVDGHPEVCE